MTEARILAAFSNAVASTGSVDVQADICRYHTVATTTSASEAAAIARSERPDVIITDYAMARRFAHVDEALLRIPTLVFVSRDEIAGLESADMHINCFIVSEPFDPRIVNAMIDLAARRGIAPQSEPDNRAAPATASTAFAHRTNVRNETLSRKIIDGISDAVFVVEPQANGVYRCVFVNGAYARLMRVTPEHIIGKSVDDIVDAEYAEWIKTKYTQAISKRAVIEYEEETQLPLQTIVLNTRLTPEFDDDGNCIRLFGVMRDITERKMAQRRLINSETRYRDLVEHMPDTIIAICGGKIVFINSAGANLFGAKSPGELIGKQILELIHPTFRDVAQKRMKGIIETGARAPMIQARFLNLAGAPIDVEVTGMPLEYLGKPSVQAVVRDISARLSTERRLRASEEKFRAIVNSANDVIFTLNNRGIFTFLSPAVEMLLGYEASQSVGRRFSDYVYPDDQRQCIDAVFLMLRDKYPQVSVEYRIRHKDGSMKWHFTTVSAQKDERGNTYGIVGIAKDITERKHSEERLREAKRELELTNEELELRVEERTTDLRQALAKLDIAYTKEKELSELKTRFISMVSHEFRTPLTGILTSSEILERYGATLGAQQRRQIFSRIYQSVHRMTGLLEEVLTHSKTTPIGHNLKPEWVDIGDICHEAVESVQAGAVEKRVIEIAIVGRLRKALLDKTIINHILTNLLSNALKYSSPDSAVRIDASLNDREVFFSIIDEGVGIPAEDLPLIFEPFHRARNVETIQGTGLGLSIVKQCAELHNGEVFVDSDLGRGATITVIIPDTLHTNGVKLTHS